MKAPREIILTRGKVALVDEADYDLVSTFSWFAVQSYNKKRWYAQRAVYDPATGKQRSVQLHRFILGEDVPYHVDHIDGDGLNCQRSNLRWATPTLNGMNIGLSPKNSSGYKGVSWNKKDKRWWAQISIDKKRTYLGGFKDPSDAARAYDKAARDLYGPFARLNFP